MQSASWGYEWINLRAYENAVQQVLFNFWNILGYWAYSWILWLGFKESRGGDKTTIVLNKLPIRQLFQESVPN